MLDREDLAARFRRGRARTRTLFEIPVEDAYYDRPIPLRNPIVFYEGHLPAFAVNTLVKFARKEKGIDANLEVLFERGIDPEDASAVRDPAASWPTRAQVRQYADAADEVLENALLTLGDDDVQIEAAGAILEHERMHQETIVYLLHALPYERKFGARVSSPALSGRGSAGEDTRAPNVVLIPAGPATLGNDGSTFGWDNEFPQHTVEVDAFEIDRFNVTNAQYLAFMDATGAQAPHFWSRVNDRWFWRGMFELIPLPLDWPVYVTHDEADAYARWQGRRLLTEAEYHRAATGIRDHTGSNVDFARWDPDSVGSHTETASDWGVHDLVGNGWEWTSTIFDGFRGFHPMRTYPRYSADFFDGAHYVLKGASPVTPRELIRRSFRNWFRPNYPYVFATFRCGARRA